MIRITPFLLLALWSAGSLAATGELQALREHIEADYQTEVSVCKEFDKAEQPACLQDAKTQRQMAYQAWWSKHDRNAAPPVYTGDLASQKKQIDGNYQAQLAVCKELDKASQSVCRSEATSRKKAALKQAMAKPNDNCEGCGVVTRVVEVDKPGEGSWMGKVGGAAAGAAIGSQIGKGKGRTAAIIAGALGGAVLGNEIESQMGNKKFYEVTVKFSDGREETVAFDRPDHGFHEGDKVKFENKTLTKR